MAEIKLSEIMELKEKSLDEVRKSIAQFGKSNVVRFEEWCELFL